MDDEKLIISPDTERENRIPPGQKLVEEWPVLHDGGIQRIDVSKWTFRVFGLVANEIKKFIPDFVIDYKVDPIRQGIADSGTKGMDDTDAREEWGWNHSYDLPAMVKDMLENISKKLNTPIMK